MNNENNNTLFLLIKETPFEKHKTNRNKNNQKKLKSEKIMQITQFEA